MCDFLKLAEKAEISEKIFQSVMALMLSKSDVVEKMVAASFLNNTTKRKYLQAYQGRLQQLTKG
jgi:serine/threonine-protein kinase HipA